MRRKRFHPLVSSVWKFNAALAAAYLAVVAAGQGGLASVTDYKDVKADPFDGMAYPIQYVPNWLKAGVWTAKTKYSEIAAADFVETPRYDAKLLAVTDENDAKALMERYTYITPYMGAYLDDARKQYAGSHLAVDVRAALGTPVHAVANGVVVRVKTDSGGDGQYVVIRHDGVPYDGQSLEMYSSYLHVDGVAVKEGQKVAKGQTVARVGMTGITTTPHLHFQMDRASAPFFPYWPFTFAEAKKAGYDMFSAVNAGLGSRAALAYTYHPFDVLNQNLDYVPSGAAPSVVTTSSAAKPVASATDAAAAKAAAEAKALAAASAASKAAAAKRSAALLAAASSSFGASAKSSAAASQPSALAAVKEAAAVADVRDTSVDPVPAAPTPAAPATKAPATPAKDSATSVKTASAPTDAVSLAAGLVFSSAPAPVAAIAVEQSFASAGAVRVTVRALDASGRATTAPVFGGVKVTLTKDFSAVASAKVAQDDFAAGTAAVEIAFGAKVPDAVRADADGMIASNGLTGLSAAAAPSKAAAAKTASAKTSAAKAKATFADVPSTSVYHAAVEALAASGVVKGVSKTRFAPANSLTRAEALAVVMRALGIRVDPSARVAMSDVPAGHWVQPYLAKAVELGAVAPGRTSFGPNVAVTRGEVAALLFALGGMPTTDLDFSKVTDVPSGAWYEKYARTAVQFGVMKAFGGKFRPTARITRGDVAVAVWNFLNKFPGVGASA